MTTIKYISKKASLDLFRKFQKVFDFFPCVFYMNTKKQHKQFFTILLKRSNIYVKEVLPETEFAKLKSMLTEFLVNNTSFVESATIFILNSKVLNCRLSPGPAILVTFRGWQSDGQKNFQRYSLKLVINLDTGDFQTSLKAIHEKIVKREDEFPQGLYRIRSKNLISFFYCLLIQLSLY